MKKKLIILSISFLSFFSTGSFAQSKNEIAIRKILQSQETSWNAGQLDNFMQGYWKSDSLMFIGKSGITYSWEKTLKNYKMTYSGAAAMGKLSLTLIQLKPLSENYYFVISKWHLERSIGNLEGYFTLLLKKINGEWLIITDHSS